MSDIDFNALCTSCNIAKSKAQPHRRMARNRSSKPFERIFVDIKGPFETMGLGNYKYVVGVVDDYSRLKIVVPLTHRGKLVEALSDIEGQLIRASGHKVSIIRMDNAGENKSSEMTAWMSKIGAKPEYTSPHSSESNGVVERAFQTISNLARTLMLQGEFKKTAWPELFRTAAYLENRLPNLANPDMKSPVELLKGSPPDLSNLHVIGSKCYVHVHAAGRLALDDRAIIGKFIGYSNNSKNFRVLLNNYKVIESSHVVFEDSTSTVPSFQERTLDSEDFRVELPSFPVISDGWTQVGPSGHHSYVVNQCGAHCNKPGPAHITAVKRIFKYLKGTKELCLTLHRQPDLQLLAFADHDADDAGEPELSDNPMRSLSGMVIGFKGVGPICTISKLQTTISRSSAESEYRCVGDCAAHIIGIRDLLDELGFKQLEPTILYEDNQACIKMTESILCSSRTRHIKRDHHFIRQLVAEKEVKLIYLATLLMIADICTKALPEVQFVKLRGMLLDWCTHQEIYQNAKRVCYNN